MFAALRRSGLPLAVAAATFALAYDNGSFTVSSRHTLALAVWWTVGLTVALGIWPRVPTPGLALLACALFAGLAAWTLASTAWASNAEEAFLEADRVLLYLGVLALVVLATTRGNVERWIDGLAAGIAAVAAVALASRLFPDVFDEGALLTYLPGARARLSFPLQYWNGLGIFTALAVPLLLRAAVGARSAAARGIAAAPAPVLAATIYFTSSRGGVATLLAGAVVALALAGRRWRTLAALGVLAVGAAAGVAVVLWRDEGIAVAVVLLVACAATGAAWAAASRLAIDAPTRRAGYLVAGATAVVLLVALVAVHPVRRFDTFKQPPNLSRYTQGDFTRAHLLSGNGSGRWQFWSSAVDEWRSAPLAGRGAGSYEAWWARTGPIPYFLRDAHSLYLETLGELGLVGGVLLFGALGCGIVGAVTRSRRTDPHGRAVLAAAGGAFGGYLVGAGIDWMWELTVVSVVGIACLGLVVGPATATLGVPRRVPRSRWGLGVAVVVCAWLVLCAEAVPLLADAQLRRSQDAAAAAGDESSAVAHARTARKLEPWASTPYLQLALVAEQAGSLDAARSWAEGAIDRDSEDWRPWLVSARIATERGDIPAARRALHRAAALNPRSPLFAGIAPGP